MSRGAVIASAVFAAVLGAAGILLVLPDAGPDLPEVKASKVEGRGRKARRERVRPPVAAEARGPRRGAGPDGKLAGKQRLGPQEGRRRIDPLAARRAPSEVGRELRGLEGEDRAVKRDELRASRFERTEERIRSLGEKSGWEEATTAQVIDSMHATHEEVGLIMEEVDMGEKTWEEARPEMRAAREAQAESMREILGDDGYREFTAAMAPSVTPIRGSRLNGPRAALRPRGPAAP